MNHRDIVSREFHSRVMISREGILLLKFPVKKLARKNSRVNLRFLAENLEVSIE